VPASRVDQIFQLFAGLEERDFLGRHFYPLAGFWVAADSWLALAGAEAAETADLDLVAHAKRAHDAIEDGLDDHLTVLTCQLRQFGDLVDQISFCHTPLSRS